ncbi:MAG: hypothetical protein AB7G06_06305 [Bdellovibrionales bacterium]
MLKVRDQMTALRTFDNPMPVFEQHVLAALEGSAYDRGQDLQRLQAANPYLRDKPEYTLYLLRLFLTLHARNQAIGRQFMRTELARAAAYLWAVQDLRYRNIQISLYKPDGTPLSLDELHQSLLPHREHYDHPHSRVAAEKYGINTAYFLGPDPVAAEQELIDTGEMSVLYETPEVRVLKMTGVNAVKWAALYTQWCTWNRETADRYLMTPDKDASLSVPLFLIEDLKTGERFQSSIGPWDLRTTDNNPIPVKALLADNPGIAKYWNEISARLSDATVAVLGAGTPGHHAHKMQMMNTLFALNVNGIAPPAAHEALEETCALFRSGIRKYLKDIAVYAVRVMPFLPEREDRERMMEIAEHIAEHGNSDARKGLAVNLLPVVPLLPDLDLQFRGIGLATQMSHNSAESRKWLGIESVFINRVTHAHHIWRKGQPMPPAVPPQQQQAIFVFGTPDRTCVTPPMLHPAKTRTNIIEREGHRPA